MGKVTSFALAGLELWFNSNDHLPPHFHAEKSGEWEVRVHFLRDRTDMFETKWTKRPGRPSQADLRQFGGLVEGSRAALLADWERKVNVKTRGGAR